MSKNKKTNEAGSSYSHAGMPHAVYIFASECDARGSTCGQLIQKGY